MSDTLIDHLLRKQADSGRILAACASIFPADTLAELAGMDFKLLQDQRAAAYLQELSKRAGDLDQLNPKEQIEVAVSVAFELGINVELAKWLGWITDEQEHPVRLAGETIRELKRLVIAQGTIKDLLLDLARDQAEESERSERLESMRLLWEASHD